MNNKWKAIIKKVCSLGSLCTFCMMVLLGCTNQNIVRQFSQKDKIHIVTTIYPMQDFATQIAGDRAEIINLVPAGVEPHDFELSAAQMQLLEDADVFIYNGAGMENFVDKTLSAIMNKDLIVVEASKDVSLLRANHSHEEEEDDDDEHFDPHTWLGIENAKLEVATIKDALCQVDSENASLYDDNSKKYLEQLDALQNDYREELESVSGNVIVVAHEAFGYLCEEQGLQQEAIEGLTADSEPDSARMKEIVDFCRDNQVKVIFFEELVSPKVAEAIANEIGAKTEVLNPIEGRTAQQEEQGLNYIDFMKQNLKALKMALE